MFLDKVTLKQLEDPASPLATQTANKHFKSKMPHTLDQLCVSKYQGRWLTGIDEDSPLLLNVRDIETRESIKAERKAERERLELLLGKDLSGTSDYWATFFVRLDSDSDLVLNKANPIQCISYYVLLENGYIAPSKEAAKDPRYRSAKYYAYFDALANKESASIQKIKDRARAELLKISDNKEYMVLIGQALEGPIYSTKQDEDTLYTMLSAFIENPKEKANRDKFLKTIAKPKEELQFRILVDRAFRAKIIKQVNGTYQRGQVSLGRTPEEVFKKLSTPEYANEFLSIREELQEA